MEKFAVITDINGYFVDVEKVPIDSNGVTEIYEPQQTEDPEEAPELILTGYRVSIPRPPGLQLYKPRYDIVAWQAALAAYEEAIYEYHDAISAYDPDSEYEPPQWPTPVDLASFWVEGLTQAELDEIANRPPYVDPVTQRIDQLEADKAPQLAVDALDDRTQGMQDIDDYTLGMTLTLEDRTQGMKDIDDYTLELVFVQQAAIEALQAQIAALETRIQALEGGSA
jgi:hypothetical protein